MSDEKPEKRYGFYSERAEHFHGSCFYYTPDGKKTVVTCVDRDEKGEGYGWADKRFVGEVTTYAGVCHPRPTLLPSEPVYRWYEWRVAPRADP